MADETLLTKALASKYKYAGEEAYQINLENY